MRPWVKATQGHTVPSLGPIFDSHTTATNEVSMDNFVFAPITTTQKNEVIVVCAGGDNSANSIPWGITDTAGLTWTVRASQNQVDGNGIRCWWAPAPNILTNDVITITSVNGISFAEGLAMSFYNLTNYLSPFDPGGDVPVTATTNASGTPTLFNASASLTTSKPKAMVFCFETDNNITSQTAGPVTGYTIVDTINPVSSPNIGNAMASQYKLMSGIQSAVNCGFGTTTGTFTMWVDALY